MKLTIQVDQDGKMNVDFTEGMGLFQAVAMIEVAKNMIMNDAAPDVEDDEEDVDAETPVQ